MPEKQIVLITKENRNKIGHLPQKITDKLNSIGNSKGDRHIILMKKCSHDTITRTFIINSVDNKGKVTSYLHIKYTCVDSNLDDVVRPTRIKKREIGIIIPGTPQFDIAINTYIEEGYQMQ